MGWPFIVDGGVDGERPFYICFLPYEDEAMRAHAKEMIFPIGAPNDGFAQYFSGKSHLAVEVPGEEGSNEWCEPVIEEEYGKMK